MQWKAIDPSVTMSDLGLLPIMISEHDPDNAASQFDKNYQHGGGWRPQPGFQMSPDGELIYPGDSPLRPRAEAELRNEIIRLYQWSYVAIIQPDGTFEVCRMD